MAKLGAPAEAVRETARLVLLTAGHSTDPGDPDGALLCDADLAVLAGDEKRYAEYAAAIRREYAHVPDADFRIGRARVLRVLLALPSIYRLPPLHEAWEATARANLTTELDRLTHGE
jgi:predicted metal-dependent HD superfamily phosphohydrolase